MESKMATKRAIDAKQPDIAGAWGIHTVFSFHKLFLCKTYMHYDAISHTYDFKKKETSFSAQLEIQDGHQYGRRHLKYL